MTTPSWLQEPPSRSFAQALAEEASAQLTKIGFPHSRHEDWRYVDLAPILNHTFSLAPNAEPEYRGPGVYLVNGQGIHNHDLPKGVRSELGQALSQSEIDPYLSAGVDSTAFSFINTQRFQDVAAISIDQNLTAPLNIYLMQLGDDARTMSHPRLSILVKEGVRAQVQIHHIGQSAAWVNAMTDIQVKENAQLDLSLVSTESEAIRTDALHVKLYQGARYQSHYFDTCTPLRRIDTQVDILADQVNCQLFGLGLLRDQMALHQRVHIRHEVPGSESSQQFKTILADRSLSEFSGLVSVFQNAHQTDSTQLNQNLLLSDHARVISRPQLCIDADDVQCAHGCTIGQFDPESVFYIVSRGLSEKEAQALLTYGFAEEILMSMTDRQLKESLEGLLQSEINYYV